MVLFSVSLRNSNSKLRQNVFTTLLFFDITPVNEILFQSMLYYFILFIALTLKYVNYGLFPILHYSLIQWEDVLVLISSFSCPEILFHYLFSLRFEIWFT